MDQVLINKCTVTLMKIAAKVMKLSFSLQQYKTFILTLVLTLFNSSNEMTPSLSISASVIARSAIPPSCSSLIFIPTIMWRTFKQWTDYVFVYNLLKCGHAIQMKGTEQYVPVVTVYYAVRSGSNFLINYKLFVITAVCSARCFVLLTLWRKSLQVGPSKWKLPGRDYSFLWYWQFYIFFNTLEYNFLLFTLGVNRLKLWSNHR